MTTPQAAAAYLAEHQREWGGKPFAIHNPSERDVNDLPVIYGFANETNAFGYHAVLVASDGSVLGGHVCSGEGYIPHDLGLVEGSRPDRHEIFRKHFPNGYRMEFVLRDAINDHAGLQDALAIVKAKAND